MEEQRTLSKMIDGRQEITEEEFDSMKKLFLKGTRAGSQNNRGINRLYMSSIPNLQNYGIYQRVIFKNGECRYIAGQSYPDEVRTVRELLAKQERK